MRKGEREARRQHVLESTLKLLEKRSFMDLGMRDIAAAAGVSPAAIYRYFGNREELLVEALIHNIIQIIQRFEVDRRKSSMSLEEFADYVTNYFIDHEATFQMTAYVMVSGKVRPKSLERFNQVMRNFLAEFDLVLRDSEIPEPVRLFSQAFFSCLAGVAMTYRNYPGRSKKEIRSHMLRLGRMIATMFRVGSSEAAKALQAAEPDN